METTMTTPRFLLAAILAATLLTLPVFAAEEQELCKSDLADSLIYRSMPTLDQLKKQLPIDGKAGLIQRIVEARQKFWETYTGKPDKDAPVTDPAKKARDNFADLLSWKDIYFLELALRWPQSKDLTERRGPGFATKVQDFLNGLLPTDGGIRQAASPEFFDWVEAVRKGFGPEPKNFDEIFKQSFNIALMGDTFWKAVDASRTQYLTYVTERDWWEFDARDHRIPPRYDTRERYAIYLYARYNKLPMRDACGNSRDMLAALKNDELVFASADLVRKAAKTPGGLLVVTVPPPMKTTRSGQKVEDPTVAMPEGVIGVYSDPVRAFEILATKDDDIRYLKWLLTRQNMPDGRYFYVAHKWDFAEKTYELLVKAFGPDDVKEAANKVRTAKKRMTSNTVMDQSAIGATRNEPFEAFEDILARKNPNPKGYVRMALALNQELEPNDINCAYAKYVSTHNEKDVLEAARRVAAGKPQLTYKNEIETIEREVESPTAVASEPSVDVESSLYLPWKGFPAGSKANYIWRGLQPPKPGSNNFIPGRTEIRSSYSLPTINNEHADVWFSEIVYDYPSGQAHPPHETEWDYPARNRIKPGVPQKPTPVPTQSGEQTLTFGGKSLQTYWESVQPNPDKCPDFVITTWTSAEVPGELVRKVEDMNCHNYRKVTETLLESFQGSRPQAALDEAARRRAAAAPPNNAKSSSAPFPIESSATQAAAALAGGTAQPMPVAGQPVGTTPTPAATAPPLIRTLPSTGNAASSLPSLGVTVPQGSVLIVHLARDVDSSINKPGSSFFGSLDQPLVINGVQIAQRGTPINAQLVQMPNGAGLTLCLTDITVAGRKYALATSQVTPSSIPTAQSEAAAAALNRMIATGGPAGAAAARARQARLAKATRPILLNGGRIYVPPMSPLAFTLAAPLVL
jgi:hypothetical protein